MPCKPEIRPRSVAPPAHAVARRTTTTSAVNAAKTRFIGSSTAGAGVRALRKLDGFHGVLLRRLREVRGVRVAGLAGLDLRLLEVRLRVIVLVGRVALGAERARFFQA